MTINPNKVDPAIKDTIIAYQNECDDVLWSYWTQGQAVNPRHAHDTYRYHSLLLRSLRDLARAEDGFGRTLLIDQIRFLCGRLGLPMPDPSLIGQPAPQLTLAEV